MPRACSDNVPHVQAASYQATVEKRLAKLEAGSKSPPSSFTEGLAELRNAGSGLGSIHPREIKQVGPYPHRAKSWSVKLQFLCRHFSLLQSIWLSRLCEGDQSHPQALNDLLMRAVELTHAGTRSFITFSTHQGCNFPRCCLVSSPKQGATIRFGQAMHPHKRHRSRP